MDSASSSLQTSVDACRAVVKYLLAFGFLSNLLVLALPLYSMQVLDRVVGSGSMDTLAVLTLIVLGALGALSLLQTARTLTALKTGEWLERRLAPLLFTRAVETAAIVRPLNASQGMRDLSLLRQFVAGPLFASAMDVPWSLIFIVLLFAIHPAIGSLTLAGEAVLIFLALKEDASTRRAQEQAGREALGGQAELEMAARNAEVVQAMGMLPFLLQGWQRKHGQALDLSVHAQVRGARYGSLSRFIRFALQVMIIGVSAYYVLHNQLTMGAIVASSILVGRALAPIETVIGSWSQIVAVREAYIRLQETLSRPSLRQEEISLPSPEGRIEAVNLSFIPPGAREPVLRGVQFRLEPGEALGIIGPSGSGKTTLIRLLAGIWHPAGGGIRLDGTETFRWRRDQFACYVGYLPQEIGLFSGTVKRNIARMDENASDERVVEAARRAGVDEMIRRLPQGYETEIGVGGARLSGGERQRIALARAVYGDPRVLIFDEPNSSLDSEGEQALASVIEQAKRAGVTVIMVSHRPSLMLLSDKILMLKNGEQSVFGSRDAVFSHLKVEVPPAPARRRTPVPA